MAENDIIILDQILSKRKESIAPELHDSTYFEIFSVEELLKDYNLDYEEIENGIVGGPNDGGIDSFFIFIENTLITGDFDYTGIKEEPQIEIVVIQSKISTGFNEKTLSNLKDTFDDLLNLKKDLLDLSAVYNVMVLDKTELLRTSISELAAKFPKIKFTFFYVNKGDSTKVHPNVIRKIDPLRNKILEFFSAAEFSFDFIGAGDLLQLSRKRKIKSLKLKVASNTISEGDGLICLVRLKDYFEFVTDENKNRLHSIFDVNVREYEGAVEVNKAIKETLQSKDRLINFWWLNNGITIVANKAPLISGDLILEDPKVVNGLQTSQEITDYIRNLNPQDDNRLILVRIIVTNNDDVRNQIIKATNNQTRIVSYSLRATEKIHQDIEQYLNFNGIFYDRQKNYYKNLDKPKNKIVSMQYIAQCVASTLLLEPNNARGRPSSLIKDNKKYQQIFNSKFDLEFYLRSIQMITRIDEYLRKEAVEHIKNERMNLRFHLVSFVSGYLVKSTKVNPVRFLKRVQIKKIDKKVLDQMSNQLWKLFESTKKELNLDGNRLARRKEFDLRIIEKIKELIK
jgi:hypothetical protein